jgi:hypothetical protein
MFCRLLDLSRGIDADFCIVCIPLVSDMHDPPFCTQSISYRFVNDHDGNADFLSSSRAWGVIPIHLMELSPGSFRTFVVGTSYQLGNLVSSASSTIEARIGERFTLPPVEKDGKMIKRYEYGTVIAIFMGCTFAYVILLTFLGPEYKGRAMGVGMSLEL